MGIADHDRIVDRLRAMPAFGGLDDGRASAIARLVRLRTAPKGSVVVSRHETGGALYLLTAGRAKACLVARDGRELTLGYLQAPDQFGSTGVAERGVRAADIVAVTDVEVLVLEASDLEQAVRLDPGLALALIAGLSRRLREATERLDELAFHDAGHRVMRVLLNVATASYGSVGAPIVRRMTHQEIATLAGTSRETVTRAIGALARDGVLLIRGRSLFVDLFKLREALGDD